MAKQATHSPKGRNDAPPARHRLTADARKSSILEAARRAFTESGDMSGTTVRCIAELAGISEGVIYRHFPSKERLFIEAVVEPLTEAIDKLVAAAEIVDRDEPLTPERQIETMNGLYRQLIGAFKEIVPLLGLVMFGDPKVAGRFYRENFTVAMERLGAAWEAVEARYGIETGTHDVTARAVMGIALIIALESRNNTQFDRDQAIALASEGTCAGFFPGAEPENRRR